MSASEASSHHLRDLTDSKTTGRGGAGSVAQDLAPIDLEKLTLEEREARDKFYKDDAKQPMRGGRG